MSLFSQVCEQAAGQEGPLLPVCRLLADALPLQPSRRGGPPPPVLACHQPRDLNSTKWGWPLGTVRGVWPGPRAGPGTQWAHTKRRPVKKQVCVHM